MSVLRGWKNSKKGLIVDKNHIKGNIELKNVLYGTDGSQGTEGTTARLPLPDEVLRIINNTQIGG